ncbi:MAG: hypothetical protein ACI81R_001035 [Bradymonadia bacterium]|jgi:hypothetical protein
MPVRLRNALAMIAGIFIGSAVNMGLISLGPLVIPPPLGVDMTTAEALAAAMPLLEPRHFVFPFLAHALGTFVGAAVACRVSASDHAKHAIGIGVFFLIGGIAMALGVRGPQWFTALDLIVAYLPMAWLATKISGNSQRLLGRVAAS